MFYGEVCSTGYGTDTKKGTVSVHKKFMYGYHKTYIYIYIKLKKKTNKNLFTLVRTQGRESEREVRHI